MFSQKIPNSPCLEIPPSPFMKRLGFGTGVNVYLVERSPKQGQFRSPWAVKKINKKCGGDKSTYLKRLKEEASILCDLSHENIVGFRGFLDQGNGECALVMEDGEKSLFSMIEERCEEERGPFPARCIITVAYDIAQALSYLHHEKLLLHGDIKSNNILVQGDFQTVKLCDFGVALHLNEQLIVKDRDDEYVGTKPWSASEVLQGAEVSNKSDIYSYAMVIYELLTLRLPHMHVFPEEDQFESEESFQEAWDQAEEIYEDSLGGRPPLLDCDYNFSYTPVIELYFVCSHDEPQQRPSAKQLVHLLESLIDLPLTNPVQKLVF